MVFQGIKNGLMNIQKINQNKKGALCPFLFTTDYVVDLAVVFYVHLYTVLVAEFAAVPYYSPNVSEGKSSTLNTSFSNARLI